MAPGFADALIGQHIQARRARTGLTRPELAGRLELTELEVLAFEQGRRRFSPATLLQFATALDCSATDLLR